ncbi:MAG: winged helix-turn-helix transcriptional regulator [Bacilli bacterium]|nr:winged helix-turn-helix transcriptional regulator [Bacilli bacterium]
MACDTPIVNAEAVRQAKESMISEDEIYNISDFFKIFGDSTRLQILCVLNNNSLTVGDLCNVINMSKSACSHQLNILRTNKLVKYQKIGKNVIYSLDDEHVSSIIDTARDHLKEK